MSNSPNNRFMNQPSGTYWRQIPIQPPAPSDPRIVNQFHSYETDSDSDITRTYGTIYSNTNSPESSTPEVSPRATPEISSAMRMRMIAHTSRPIPSVHDNGMNYTDGIDDQNNGAREVSEFDEVNNEMNGENIPQKITQNQQDQPDEPTRIFLVTLQALRQRVRELDSDAWMYVKANDRFSKF
ncbi:hypothetical protein RclHR1_20460003 [Rhizophagus clarus]|uniref:Uncharacterized protein n=1 Tax=Rhizophagus clarus TaxID=94130 RepID=A0A2Z6RK05_9GLOM|nr:hypothetical protein RclHR1_20460003 [Rhizophagus clarus]